MAVQAWGDRRMRRIRMGGGLLGLLLATFASASAADFANPLPIETSGAVKTLPAAFPSRWVFLDYIASPGLSDSKIELLDPGARSAKQVIGQIGADYYANFLQGTARPELYVAETFFSRGTRGTRTDVITIYDAKTLTPGGEIVLPGARRWVGVMQPNAFQFADHEKLGLVYNFTPASSVTVVNLETRQVLSQVPLPGCALIYPTGPRGFSSLCANGTMLGVQLDGAGAVSSQTETPPFNDLADDPLFSAPATIGATNFFISYKGRVQPIDLSAAAPRLLPAWSLVTEEEAKANWRPSGSQLAVVGAGGRLFVIMQPNGKDGSHMDGGNEVWVFDTASHAKVATIKLKSMAQCIGVSGDEHPQLLATTLSATLDSYDAATGAFTSRALIPSLGAQTLIYPVRR
jgi:methylamine dehydrogenase heavy chain